MSDALAFADDGDLGRNLENLVEVLADGPERPNRIWARSTKAWRMRLAAPASTPQVGWLTIKTAG